MVASVQNPADMVNLALARIGSKHSIGDIFDGSMESNIALNVYSQTRDAVLMTNDWDFAQKIVLAAATGGTPPSNWTNEYTYPADCLRIRSIYNSVYLADKNNPLPTRWKLGDSVVNNKVVWCNVASATFIYTAQVTNPLYWGSLFVDMFSVELGKTLALALGVQDAGKMMLEVEKTAVPNAVGVLG